jgi:outer membrane protein, multidrug efflux system
MMRTTMTSTSNQNLTPARPVALALLLAAAALASGCAVLPGAGDASADAKAATLPPKFPTQWQSPLPHNGNLADMRQWWQRLGDPLLVELIEAGQAASPSLASAKSRIVQARATRTSSSAALLPTLDASLAASRGATQLGVPVASTVQAGLQAGWEIDLFGANRAASNAAQTRLEGAQAQWHDARVSVAAEVANQYVAVRSCFVQLGLLRADATSRAETSRLSALTTRAGLTPIAQDALARASALDASSKTRQQLGQCDIDIKSLVALTALPEPDLRAKLAVAPVNTQQSALVYVAAIPAQALAQRPDVLAAERDMVAASQDVQSTDAQRYPRLSLSGSVGLINAQTGGASTDLSTWSIGPLALTLPLFDGGKRAANVESARARYDEAVALYQFRARTAVREVEQALVSLQSINDRAADTQGAADSYRAALKATQARQSAGLASLPELEDARRTALAADSGLLSLQREAQLAWIALYRAVGGGWQASDLASAAAMAAAPAPTAQK